MSGGHCPPGKQLRLSHITLTGSRCAASPKWGVRQDPESFLGSAAVNKKSWVPYRKRLSTRARNHQNASVQHTGLDWQKPPIRCYESLGGKNHIPSTQEHARRSGFSGWA